MADRYWWPAVANSSQTWAAARWSSTPSPTFTNAATPVAADNVILDNVVSGTGTLTISAAAVARSLDANTFVGTLAGTSTLGLGDATLGTGNRALRLGAGMTVTYSGTMSFLSTNGTQQSITTNGKSIGNVTFNGTGGSWALADALSCGSVVVTRGAFTDAGFGGTWTSLISTTAVARSITISGAVSITTTTLVVNFTNTALLTTNITGTFTANNVGGAGVLTGAGFALGSWVFAGTNPTVVMTGANSFINFTLAQSTGTTNNRLQLGSPITVTGTLTLTGKDAQRFRILVQSGTLGTAVTVTAAVTILTNIDFQDITAAGAGGWTGVSLGDFLGNSGVTFDASVPNFWVGGTGLWHDPTHWASGSGGVGGTGRVPLPQDDAKIDASSGAGTISVRQARIGRNLDWSTSSIATIDSDQSITLGNSVTGNLVFGSGVTWTNTQANPFFLRGRSAKTITYNGATFNPSILDVNGPGGTYTIQDSASTPVVTISLGSLTAAAGVPVAFTSLTLQGGGWVGGSSNWSIESTTFAVAGGVFTPGTSTLTMTGPSGAITNNTLGTVTLWDVAVAGAQGYFLGSQGFTVHNFVVVAGATVGNFPGMTVTFSLIWLAGTSGNHIVVTNSGQFTWSCGGLVLVAYADIDHCIAAGASIPFHDQNGVDNGNNVNWLFDQLVTLSDSQGFTDAVASGLLVFPSSDLGGLTDKAAPAAGVVAANPMGLSDAPSVAPGVVVSDAEGLTDVVTIPTMTTTINDAEELIDEVTLAADLVVNDLVGLSDVAMAVPGVIVNDVTIDDAEGLTDAAETAATAALADLDDLSDENAVETAPVLDDLGELGDSTVADVTVVLDDQDDLDDEIVPDRIRQEIFDDALGLADSIAIAIAAFINDNGELTDPVAANITFLLEDSGGLGDDPFVSVDVVISDPLGLLDDLTALMIHGVLGCMVILLDVPNVDFSLDSPQVMIDLEVPRVLIAFEEC